MVLKIERHRGEFGGMTSDLYFAVHTEDGPAIYESLYWAADAIRNRRVEIKPDDSYTYRTRSWELVPGEEVEQYGIDPVNDSAILASRMVDGTIVRKGDPLWM